MLRVILAIGLSIAVSSTVLSQDTGGSGTMEELVKKCQGNAGSNKDAIQKILEDAIGTGQCIGFLGGILDANSLEQLNASARVTVAAALMQAFPCKK
jgi:hypothetical protein